MKDTLKAKCIGLEESQIALVSSFLQKSEYSLFNSDKYFIFPGFTDVHVHFREPGFSYKETILSGSRAAAAGGYTSVCTMPNLNPVPDSVESILLQKEIIDRDAVVDVYPYASITVGQKGEQLSDLEGMKDIAIAYSDDGRGVQSDEMMLEAMKRAKALGKMIVAHCEVNDLLEGGYIHKGEYAKAHDHRGICSESEYKQIERDLLLAKRTGVKYHVCHISCKESVELIRQAKRDGIDVTCETGPHYLVLDDSNLKEEGRFKMNPPLRDKKDKEALIEGVIDGTVDMIATDHAPHSAEEKARGLEKSAFGIVGLETAFSVMYTHLVKNNVITLERLIELLTVNPQRRFGIRDNGFSIWDLEEQFTVETQKFLSMGKATPFEGDRLFAQCLLTVKDDNVIYMKNSGGIK